MDYAKKRVTVMGLGHFGGGAAAARWLAEQGARVTVTDLASESTLAAALASLDGAPIEAVHLDGHCEGDFRDADLVVVNPAVRPDNAFLQVARQSGTRLTTEIGILLDAVPCPAIGVTGSNGKSTTTAMIAEILRHDGRRVWLGGNLGGSLLESLGQMRADDRVVLELSSFQLTHVPPDATMPGIAVVTNCTPNHLDWHGDWESYVAAKQRLLAGQLSDGVAILGAGLADDRAWKSMANCRKAPLFSEKEIPPLKVPGKHNRDNAVCAATAALAAGCSRRAVDDGLRSFSGLPGRLEHVAAIDGRDFINDTTSTTPESTIAAMASLDRPVWLLVGGGDKGADFEPLIGAVVANACGVAVYGAVGPRLLELLARRGPRPPRACHETIDEALPWCWAQSRLGESIVLSPGCTSHDQFRNFERRGEHFVELVSQLAKLTQGSRDATRLDASR